MGNSCNSYSKKFIFSNNGVINPKELFDNILESANNVKNLNILENKYVYDKILFAEYISPTCGFIDDIEIYVGKNKSQIYVKVRSESRMGFYDFGKNKEHIKEIIMPVFNKYNLYYRM